MCVSHHTVTLRLMGYLRSMSIGCQFLVTFDLWFCENMSKDRVRKRCGNEVQKCLDLPQNVSSKSLIYRRRKELVRT